MTEEIIISGFGGQGVLSMGKMLAYAGIMEGKEVSWMPAYGPEQRGGTANVTVILSDDSICSPIVDCYDTAIVLNQPSLERFQPLVRPGGTLIYDPYGIFEPPTRPDLHVWEVKAMEEAARMENPKVFNMLVLGALLKARPLLAGVDDVVRGLHKALPPRHQSLIPLNERALRRGMEIASVHTVSPPSHS